MVLAVVMAGLAVQAGASASGGGSPTATGPLTLSGGACQPTSGCAFDFVLDPTQTSDPSDSWHAYWTSTATSKVQTGWCALDAIANLSWGDTGPAGTLPAATYPSAGSTMIGANETGSLLVDAAGKATTPGRLRGRGMPAGLVTTWVHRGYMTTLWQGRATLEAPLVLAAEISNPTGGGPAPPGSANDYNVGLPCADFAPPGRSFLARFAHSTIRSGQTAYLELRIPATGLRWTITPKLDEQTAIDGKATIQMVGSFGSLTTRAKPQTLRFADRYTFETRPGFGTWTAIVTLQGPTGTRHFKIPLTVRG